MKLRLPVTVAAVFVCGGIVLTGNAGAGIAAKTTVTIESQNGDFSGLVKSPKPRLCAEDRKVILFKQTGREQNPKQDEKIASDNASRNGNQYQWSTGNTGQRSGRFYARAPRIPGCKPDSSPTVRP